jgi:hypothetical protein
MKYNGINPINPHGWNNGISAERIIDAMNSLKAEAFIYNLYRLVILALT